MQDDLADTFGQMTIILTSHRWTKTGLWFLFQWPHEAACALPFEGGATENSLGKFMKKLHLDHKLFLWLVLMPNKTACISALVTRSVFQPQSVKQLVQAEGLAFVIRVVFAQCIVV